MLPGYGNGLSTADPEITAADGKKLSNCLWDAGGPECGYRPLYTPCPAPESGPQGDDSQPTDFAFTVLPMPTGEGNTERMLRVSWKYLNSYGNVPHRDDVRVNVAIREVEIPTDCAPPSEGD